MKRDNFGWGKKKNPARYYYFWGEYLMPTNLRVTTLGEIRDALDDFRHVLSQLDDKQEPEKSNIISVSGNPIIIKTTTYQADYTVESSQQMQLNRLRRKQQLDWPKLGGCFFSFSLLILVSSSTFSPFKCFPSTFSRFFFFFFTCVCIVERFLCELSKKNSQHNKRRQLNDLQVLMVALRPCFAPVKTLFSF